MTIGVDGNEANVEKKVGVSVYTYELLMYFSEHADAETQFVIYLRSHPLPHLPKPTAHFRYVIIPGKGFWRDVFFPMHLYTHRDIDILFSPAHYTPRYCPVPVVVTIHDLGYVAYPQDFLKKDLYKLESWTAHAVKQAKKVIAVSEFTRRDVAEHYKIPHQKIVTIYNGYKESSKPSKTIPVKKPFILYVSTLQPRKNVLTLIDAFELFHNDHPEYKLVIVGKKGWMYGDLYQRVAGDLEKHVIFTGYLSDDTVAALYTQAACYVLPSFYEGFGITILEAMHFGCPVIAAHAGALPEVGGKACLYFDPHDTMELQKTLSTLVTDRTLRQKLVEKGRIQATKFSWETTGRETLEILKNV